jgi:mannose-1-phosphate guanylyltransferase
MVFTSKKFVEKPDAATAQQYLVSGDYLWNCGVFMFRAATCWKPCKAHAPAVLDACKKAYADHSVDLDLFAWIAMHLQHHRIFLLIML